MYTLDFLCVYVCALRIETYVKKVDYQDHPNYCHHAKNAEVKLRVRTIPDYLDQDWAVRLKEIVLCSLHRPVCYLSTQSVGETLVQ